MPKLNISMNVQEVFITMAQGNPGALACMIQMMQEDCYFIQNIFLLDSLEIYGSKIYILWNDCCDREMEKFKKTLQAFREESFTKEQIHKNLNSDNVLPFIKD